MTRIIIRTNDVANLLGLSLASASRNLRLIKDALGKQKHQKITVKEFCDYVGLDENEVKAKIK